MRRLVLVGLLALSLALGITWGSREVTTAGVVWGNETRAGIVWGSEPQAGIVWGTAPVANAGVIWGS